MPVPAIVLACALLWALMAPQRSLWLTLWLVAQLLYIPAIWGAYFFTQGYGIIYLQIYAVFTGVILTTCLGMAFSALGEPRRAVISAAGGISVCVLIALLEGCKSLSGDAVVQMGEIVLLTFSALVLGLSAHGRDRMIPATLSLLWLCQAGIRAGVILHESKWHPVTEWLPAALLIAAVTWLGGCLRWAAMERRTA